MDISGINSSNPIQRLNKASSLGAVQALQARESEKIDQWVEMLMQMPDIRDIAAPSRPDPKKIADAMIRNPS